MTPQKQQWNQWYAVARGVHIVRIWQRLSDCGQPVRRSRTRCLHQAQIAADAKTPRLSISSSVAFTDYVRLHLNSAAGGLALRTLSGKPGLFAEEMKSLHPKRGIDRVLVPERILNQCHRRVGRRLEETCPPRGSTHNPLKGNINVCTHYQAPVKSVKTKNQQEVCRSLQSALHHPGPSSRSVHQISSGLA